MCPTDRRVNYELSVLSLADVVNFFRCGLRVFSGNMRFAMLRDKFGTSWMILNPKRQSA
jgi:hypothetical protein